MAPPAPQFHGFYDKVVKKEMCFSLGFLKPNRTEHIPSVLRVRLGSQVQVVHLL